MLSRFYARLYRFCEASAQEGMFPCYVVIEIKKVLIKNYMKLVYVFERNSFCALCFSYVLLDPNTKLWFCTQLVFSNQVVSFQYLSRKNLSASLNFVILVYYAHLFMESPSALQYKRSKVRVNTWQSRNLRAFQVSVPYRLYARLNLPYIVASHDRN
jgi:hypothetical protein